MVWTETPPPVETEYVEFVWVTEAMRRVFELSRKWRVCKPMFSPTQSTTPYLWYLLPSTKLDEAHVHTTSKRKGPAYDWFQNTSASQREWLLCLVMWLWPVTNERVAITPQRQWAFRTTISGSPSLCSPRVQTGRGNDQPHRTLAGVHSQTIKQYCKLDYTCFCSLFNMIRIFLHPTTEN